MTTFWFSSYQIIVLEVIDGNDHLPDDYSQKLDNSNEKQMVFYIAAEIKNIPLLTEPWEFYVGNEETYDGYENKKLQRGHDYIVYQRAITSVENVSKEDRSWFLYRATYRSKLERNRPRALLNETMLLDGEKHK